MQIPAKDMMPTWKQDHIYLFIKANPTKDLFLVNKQKRKKCQNQGRPYSKTGKLT